MKVKDLVSLSDKNKYVVVQKIDYEGKTYYYLVDIEKNENIKFGYQDNDEFVEVTDSSLLEKLIPIFGKQALKILNDAIENKE
ncbi:MAG: hypothetical protein IK137_00315 [Bacilli bacterium]|nr:hypothetical protein [Bacilli bacterium]